MTACYRTAILLLLAVIGNGCAMRGNVDLLESRLRQQEDSLSQLQSQLAKTQNELASTRSEADSLRSQMAGRGEPTLLPEQANVLYRASGIEIDRFRSGGLESDGKPGDDVLTAAIVPHDKDGELVKLAGAVEFELLDLTKPKDQQRIGRWTFDSEQSREHWSRGFLGSGYFFKVPLQQQPQSSQLVLHATLTAPDGRRFDASEKIRVNPPGSAGDVGATTVAGSRAAAPRDAQLRPPGSSGPPGVVRAGDREPGTFQPSSGIRLMAPPLEPTSTSDPANGNREISYERQHDPLLELSPIDPGDRKARASGAQRAPSRISSKQSRPTAAETPTFDSASWAGQSSRPGTTNASDHGSDFSRPGAIPPDLDEFGLPKSRLGSSSDAAPTAPNSRSIELSPSDRSDRKPRVDAGTPEWAD